MSIWADRVKTHSVWQQLKAIGPVIDQALSRDEVSASVVSSLNRIRTVAAFVDKRLSAADSLLIQPSSLDSLASALQSTISEVQNFIANGNEGHLVNANTNVDGVLTHLAQIVIPVSSKDLLGLKEAADAYRAALESNLGEARDAFVSYNTDLTALQEKLVALTSEVSTERQRLSSLASEHQLQFSGAQETRSKDYIEAQASRQDKFSGLISDYAQKLVDQTADFGRQRDLLTQSQRDDLATLTTTYRERATILLNEIQEQRTQVEKLVGVIGNLGVTSGYQKSANEAKVTARVWQGVAVVSLGAVIFVAYKAFLPLVQGAFTWEGFAGRVFVSLTVGVLAAYAISQADKYQQVERRSRKLALELEALGPFMASLPTDKQEEFRLRVGDRSFGTSDDLIDGRSTDSPKSVFDVALKSKDLRDFVVELVKAAKG